MSISTRYYRLLDFYIMGRAKILRKLGLQVRPVPFSQYEARAEMRDELAAGVEGDLAKIFFNHRGRTVHKWIHYLEAYDRHFARYRNTPVKMLEIGVFQGGSLEMWREYFGPQATIFGVDIDSECAGKVNEPNQVRIGSQDDPEFLRRVVEEMGAPDIVLDDGSHIACHQRASFDVLFPLLKNGGIYAIEDLHSAYWPGFHQGGHGRKDTAIGLVKNMIDDLHGWYHTKPLKTNAKDSINAIHVYDSIVILEKKEKIAPIHIKVQ